MTRPQTTSDAGHLRRLPPPKSFFSKFASPLFSSKQRSPVDHEIRLDEPFRQFFSGDSVKGAVVVNAAKPFRITHLVIRLHGFVKVVNNARLPGETVPYDENLLTSMRNRRGIEYFGNGFARLFEEESILCGDGRLFGKYQFRFDLTIPSSIVPSSIDFEHGTISYLLSSTLTRPATISPTLTIHQRLKVTGNIDIARLQAPKSRTVTIEAVGRKSKPRLRVIRRNTGLQNSKESNASSVEENSINRTSVSSPQLSDAPPRSPCPSDSSSASAESSTLSASNAVGRHAAGSEIDGSLDNFTTSGGTERTITARTELLHSGCLPGDTLHLRVSVEHVKPVKTMQGLIITLFRQGRIDTHPAIPLGPMDTGDRRQYEDYYPRSRTGLGGLSLSSAGSSRAFRQDLAQTMTPLFVDPQSLTATVKTSIQMPDHVFPTITCVPGDMISFKYYVEVVINLRGKHAGQDRFLPHLNIIEGPQHAYGDPKLSKVEGVDGISYSATPGFNYLITDQIRRTKGVVFTTTEVVVGTRDSTRARGKQKESIEAAQQGQVPESSHGDENSLLGEETPVRTTQTFTASVPHSTRPALEHRSRSIGGVSVPLPEIDEDMDEKAQIRRAEERLLPNAAPEDEDGPSFAAAPSAPFAFDEDDFVQRYGFTAPAPAYEVSSNAPPIHTDVLTAPAAPNAGELPDPNPLQPSDEELQNGDAAQAEPARSLLQDRGRSPAAVDTVQNATEEHSGQGVEQEREVDDIDAGRNHKGAAEEIQDKRLTLPKSECSSNHRPVEVKEPVPSAVEGDDREPQPSTISVQAQNPRIQNDETSKTDDHTSNG